jgi:hypothetical protein
VCVLSSDRGGPGLEALESFAGRSRP